MSRLTYSDSGHRYYLDGAAVPSVTQILGKALAKPALVNAAAREAALYAVRNTEALALMDEDVWVQAVSAAPRKVWGRRAKDGQVLHRLAESMVNGDPMPADVFGEPVPAEVRDMATQLAHFFDAWDVAPVLVEAMVFHEDHFYAGRLDLVADLADGTRWLLDYKTGSSGIWPETSMQQTAYRYASHYVAPETDADQAMDALGIDHCGAVWVRPDTWELVPVKSDADVFRTFLDASRVAHWAGQTRRASVLPTVPRPAGVA